MAYEFKKLSDVETVAEPTETANVLIEENGIIKKAPKTAVGGNGTWDAIIDCGDATPSAYSDPSLFVFESGDYNTVKSKWDEGEIPKIMLKYVDEYEGDFYYHRAPSQSIVQINDSCFLLHFIASDFGNISCLAIQMTLDEDNTISDVSCVNIL